MRTFRRWRQHFEPLRGPSGLVGPAAAPRLRASGFHRIGARKWRRCIAAVTKASRPSIFTSIWRAATVFPGATPGRRRSCIRPSAGSGGLLERAKRRGAHRRKRPRRPMPGLMPHQPFGGLRRIKARMARRPAGARSDRHAGRCDERYSCGLSGRGGRHGVDVPGPGGRVWPALPLNL